MSIISELEKLKLSAEISVETAVVTSTEKQYNVWVKLLDGEYHRLRSFTDEELAEKFLEYADRYFEIHDEIGVDDLFLKREGEPVYQIYYLDPDGIPTIVDQEYHFDLEETMNEIRQLSEDNPFSQYDYQEVDLDQLENPEPLVVSGL